MADNLPREFLHERDARIFALKQSGLSNQDIAKRFDMTAAAVAAAAAAAPAAAWVGTRGRRRRSRAGCAERNATGNPFGGRYGGVVRSRFTAAQENCIVGRRPTLHTRHPT